MKSSPAMRCVETVTTIADGPPTMVSHYLGYSEMNPYSGGIMALFKRCGHQPLREYLEADTASVLKEYFSWAFDGLTYTMGYREHALWCTHHPLLATFPYFLALKAGLEKVADEVSRTSFDECGGYHMTLTEASDGTLTLVNYERFATVTGDV